jgi:hypothetical protein
MCRDQWCEKRTAEGRLTDDAGLQVHFVTVSKPRVLRADSLREYTRSKINVSTVMERFYDFSQ